MTDLSVKKNISNTNRIYLLISLLLSIGFQVIVIRILPQYSILVLAGIIALLLVMVISLLLTNDLPLFLILLSFLPLILLNNDIHYNFRFEFISFFPLFILIILALYHYLVSVNDFKFQFGYLRFPIIILVFYFGLKALISISQGKEVFVVFVEYFHFCLYLSIIPISFLFVEAKKYKKVLKFLFIISIFISIEYIIYNQIIYQNRFVTFQAGFLPIAVGVVLAFILYRKSKVQKFGFSLILFILLAGIFSTLTRTVWATSFLVLMLVLIIYLHLQKKINFLKIFILFLILILPIIFVSDSGPRAKKQVALNTSVEQRTKSISDPLEDISFLMRIEMSYYAWEKFLENPIFGKDLGEYLKYKIFRVTSAPVYYIDNSWFYLMWKGGIIGLILYIWLYLRFIKAVYFVVKKSNSTVTKIICSGLLGGFIGLFFLAFLSPLLFKYKSNILIAFLFAYVEFERSKILNSNPTREQKLLL